MWFNPHNNYLFSEKVVHGLLIDVHKRGHLTDTGLDEPLNLEQDYVRLKLLEQNTVHAVEEGLSHLPHRYLYELDQCRGKSISLHKLIEDNEFGKYVLICGRAGFGKSTLLQWLLWTWANGNWAKKLKAIFMINLRYIMRIHEKIDLCDLLSRYTVYNGGSTAPVDLVWLQENEGNIGIVIGKRYCSPNIYVKRVSNSTCNMYTVKKLTRNQWLYVTC